MANNFQFNDNTSCPVDCSTPNFPALPAAITCLSNQTTKSQLCDLVIDITGTIMTGMTFTDAAMPGFMTANVDNANTDNTKLRVLEGIGGGNTPAVTTRPAPKGKTRTISTITTHTWTFEDISDDHYEFFRYLQCVSPQKVMWGNVGGHFFGGEEGVELESFQCYPVDNGGVDDVEQWQIVYTFDAKIAPKRIANPIP